MQVPARSNPVWEALLTGSKTASFDVLGLNIMIFNLKNRVRKNPEELEDSIKELMGFFQDNLSSPKVQKAVSRIGNLIDKE